MIVDLQDSCKSCRKAYRRVTEDVRAVVTRKNERNTYILESFVNDARVLEVVVGEKVDLIEEVADVDTAERIHL